MTDLQEWTTRLADALGVPADLDIDLILDVARDAAHGVARPAAPLTTFLVGYAAALRGGSAADVAEAARIAQELALDAGTSATGTGAPQPPAPDAPDAGQPT